MVKPLGEATNHKEEKEVLKDLMHYLLNNIDRKTGRRPDRSELNSGSLNIINAGADLFACGSFLLSIA